VALFIHVCEVNLEVELLHAKHLVDVPDLLEFVSAVDWLLLVREEVDERLGQHVQHFGVSLQTDGASGILQIRFHLQVGCYFSDSVLRFQNHSFLTYRILF